MNFDPPDPERVRDEDGQPEGDGRGTATSFPAAWKSAAEPNTASSTERLDRPFEDADPTSTTNDELHGAAFAASTLRDESREPGTANEDLKTAESEAQPHRRLDQTKFPHPPLSPGGTLPGTLLNLEHLLRGHGIGVHWDVIRKRTGIRLSNGQEASLNEVFSLAALNGFPSGNMLPFLSELGRRSPVNPVGEWICSKPWDGQDRMNALYATVTTAAGYIDGLKEKLLYRWLLSAVAAALKKRGFRSRGVLTFQGPQAIGKTTWMSRLMPPGSLRDNCIKLDFYMDGGSKDSQMIAMQHWIVELGEFETSFRKEMGRLKGFLTLDCDKLRPPYARSVEEHPRRTVFAATVNGDKFLIDPTGNSRWWTIPVTDLDYNHSIDMQQVFAQLAVDFEKGEQWWLNGVEEAALGEWNKQHRVESAIAEQVREYLNKNSGRPAVKVTATEMLRLIGVQRPTNPQCRECGAVLRDVLGPPRRIRGTDKWPVPVHFGAGIDEDPNDPDLY
jgi:hypothetical protein